MATVDQSSIRGSKPHERVSSRAYLGLSAGVGVNRPKGAHEGCPDRSSCSRPDRPGGPGAYGTASFTSRPIAHTKPESSRAIAATTTVGFFPPALSVR